MSTTYVSTVDTPAGPFTVVADDDGAVLASGWTSTVDDLLSFVPMPSTTATPRGPRRCHEGRGGLPRRRSHRDRRDPGAAGRRPVPRARLGRAARGAGRRAGHLHEFADLAGRPAAVRAAAMACARNAAALFVPCHRVLRLDGSLGGFRWGLPVKRWLLAHEAA